jgi:hypothetical protein
MSVSDPAPPPALTSRSFPTYAGPGYAEVKPHNVPNIKAGLIQLYVERQKRVAQGKSGRPYLLTYDHHLSRTPGGSTVVVYLLEPNDASLVSKQPEVPRATSQSWLNGLGSWWSLGNLTGPEHSLGQWQDLVGPTAFGSMIEPFVRREFFKKFGPPKQHLTKVKLPNVKGADVDWLEVAEFLYELAAELGEAA